MGGISFFRAARVALPALALLCAFGCGAKKGGEQRPASESYDAASSPDGTAAAPAPPPVSEGQRTREMQAKQAEMDQKLEDAKASGMTPEEAEKAYQQYERDRQELNKMSDTAAPPPADAPPADPPAGDYPPPPN